MTRTDILKVPEIHEGVAIAIIVAVLCLGCWYGAHAWQALSPLPVSYPRAIAEPAATPDPPKALTEPLRPVLVQTESLRLDPTAKSTRWTPLPWTCSEIRAYAKTHTEAEMKAKADEHRLTQKQRDAAKDCLTRKRADRRDKRCDTPARYEAMSEGANCS